MLVMEVIAVLNFSTAFSSSCSSTNEGLAGILGGGCMPSDLGMPITTSYITPHAVRRFIVIISYALAAFLVIAGLFVPTNLIVEAASGNFLLVKLNIMHEVRIYLAF